MAGLYDGAPGLSQGAGLCWATGLTGGPGLTNTTSLNVLALPGLALWLDASDASTITIATGVSQWNDKSGLGNNATQATGAAQPTVQTAAQNGKNTIRFTSANTQKLALTSAITVYPSGYTIYAVCRRAGPTGTNIVEIASAGGVGIGLEWAAANLGGNINGRFISSAPQASTAYNVAAVQMDGLTNATIWFNGASIASGTSIAGSGITTLDTIGQGDGLTYMNGEVGEIILCTALHSAAQVAAVFAYLKSKWATP